MGPLSPTQHFMLGAAGSGAGNVAPGLADSLNGPNPMMNVSNPLLSNIALANQERRTGFDPNADPGMIKAKQAASRAYQFLTGSLRTPPPAAQSGPTPPMTGLFNDRRQSMNTSPPITNAPIG